RLAVAAEARALGRGGVSIVARASGLSRPTVYKAMAELDAPPLDPQQVRASGGGRKKTVQGDPRLLADLERLVDPATRGDPVSPLRWTTKSTRALADALGGMGNQVSHVGVDHDTAAFAVAAIRAWWYGDGAPAYPKASRLLITADAGGSNSYRSRLWKTELAALADQTSLAITVCHFPPGTSKWNRVEHRLFSYISTNWRGQPLVSLAVIVSLIGATRTAAGLRVRCELDRGVYPKGQAVSDAQMPHSISSR